MSSKRVLDATFWSMVVLNTIGSIDPPGSGGRKMPAPRVYVAAVVLWSILGLVAEAGPNQGRVAAKLSYLVLATGALIGPFGKKFLGFLEGVAGNFAVPPPADASTTTATPPEVIV